MLKVNLALNRCSIEMMIYGTVGWSMRVMGSRHVSSASKWLTERSYQICRIGVASKAVARLSFSTKLVKLGFLAYQTPDSKFSNLSNKAASPIKEVFQSRKMAAHRKLSDTHTIILELQPALKEKKLVLFLDYDGTLAELTTSPDDTFMTTHMTKVLGEVSRLEDVVVVAITGRKTEDIKNRLALTNIIYSGNHGLEVCLNGKGTTYTLGDEELKVLRKSVQNVIDELREKKLGKECGGNIEDKETAMTWHFFDVPESEEEEIVKKASEIVERNGFPVFRGHGCIEVRHPKITKGNAMKKILYEKFGENWHEKYCAIFIGDSSSDEEGFAALCSDPEFRSDRVIFIKIQQDGLMATAGRYIFHGPDDVYALLCALKDFYQK